MFYNVIGILNIFLFKVQLQMRKKIEFNQNERIVNKL